MKREGEDCVRQHLPFFVYVVAAVACTTVSLSGDELKTFFELYLEYLRMCGDCVCVINTTVSVFS